MKSSGNLCAFASSLGHRHCSELAPSPREAVKPSLALAITEGTKSSLWSLCRVRVPVSGALPQHVSACD